MTHERLDQKIYELKQLLVDLTSPLSTNFAVDQGRTFGTSPFNTFKRTDWRPFWDAEKEIQAAFSAKVRYPTSSERDQAWTKFNDLRNEARRLQQDQKERFLAYSKGTRDQILNELPPLRYSFHQDALWLVAKTTVDDMKQMQRRLNEVRSTTREKRSHMLKAHYEECLQAILEVQKTHDSFWNSYKEHHAAKQAAYRANRADRVSKALANIERNKEKLEKASAALARVESQIEDLSLKLVGARSTEWRDRFSEWLATAEAKRASIAESIDRIVDWIAQDKARLDELTS